MGVIPYRGVIEVNDMESHMIYFKNLPLKLKIIGFILLIYEFVLLSIYIHLIYINYMIHTYKIPYNYGLILATNGFVVSIGVLLFAIYMNYRKKRK